VRRIKIHGTPPPDWLAEAQRYERELYAAPTKEKRDKLITTYESHWTDDRIRDWLLSQFSDKCWYTEAKETISPIHVDHYRPKGRVRNHSKDPGDEGYWWLAFNWENYRIAGWLINSKKSDIFPIMHGSRALPDDAASLALECPVLIDPKKEEARLVSYEKQDEEVCIAVSAARIDADDTYRVDMTIEVLGLNIRPKLNRKRAEYWDKCSDEIANFKSATSAGAETVKWILRENAIVNLRKMIAYEAEFSSVVEACIRKTAPDALVAAVFD
jgi:hypothetical protein